MGQAPRDFRIRALAWQQAMQAGRYPEAQRIWAELWAGVDTAIKDLAGSASNQRTVQTNSAVTQQQYIPAQVQALKGLTAQSPIQSPVVSAGIEGTTNGNPDADAGYPLKLGVVVSGEAVQPGSAINVQNGAIRLATAGTAGLECHAVAVRGGKNPREMYYRCGGHVYALVTGGIATGSRLFLSTTPGFFTENSAESGKAFHQDCGQYHAFITSRQGTSKVVAMSLRLAMSSADIFGLLTVHAGDPFRFNVVGAGRELEGINGTWVLPASTQLIWAGTDATSDGTSYSANEAMLVVTLPIQYNTGSPVTWSEHGSPIWDYLDAATGFSHRRTYHGEDRYYDFADGTLKASIGMGGLDCETGQCFLGGYVWPSPQSNSYHGFSSLSQNDVHAGDAIYAGDPDGTITGTINTNGHIHSYGNLQVNPRVGTRSNLGGVLIGGANLTDSQFRFYADSTGLHILSADDGILYTGTEQISLENPVNTTAALTEISKRVVVPDRVTAGAGISIASNNGAGTVVVTNTGVIAEADTLATVTARGATTSTATTLSSTSNDLHGKVTIDATGHSGVAVLDGVDVVTVMNSVVTVNDVIPCTCNGDASITNGQPFFAENIVAGVSFDVRCGAVTGGEASVNWRIIH